MGFFVAALILVIQQVIYISSIDWVTIARIVSLPILKKGEVIFCMNFIQKAHERSVEKEIEMEREVEVEHEIEEEEKGLLPPGTASEFAERVHIEMPLKDPRSKFYVLVKKVLCLILFIAFFLASLALRFELNSNPILTKSLNSTSNGTIGK